MRPLRALLAVLAVPAALVAGGCSSSVSGTSTAASGPKTAKAAGSAHGVTLRVGVQKDGIRSILAASGALKGLPYKISYSVFAFGPPLVEAAGADKIDVAGVGDTPPLFGAAAGSDFRVIAQTQFTRKQDDWLLVAKGSAARTARDLRGKTIAVAKGSSANGFLLRWLDRNGLKQSDVKIVYLAPADGLAAFSTHRVDAWVAWQPFATEGEAAGGRPIAGGPPDEHGYNFEIASTKAVEDPKTAAALKDFLVRLRRAESWAATHQVRFAAAWSKESSLPLSVTRRAARDRVIAVAPVGEAARRFESSLAATLLAHKAIPKKVDFDSIVTTGLAPAPGS